ncbi:MAG TPA: hypothetical protein VJ698_01195 [Noviherbaspirillum sp.]|uniref:hypothetical protein n=1 Tax=Noviherbaspirillum sp. TaxID=1926288 RepID=UPI002B46E0B2|nr:hypothetical protein [Noviherbaspirillum sp.]HJV84063.1 hypothetical protein [Noviherbaspirillum sp.]
MPGFKLSDSTLPRAKKFRFLLWHLPTSAASVKLNFARMENPADAGKGWRPDAHFGAKAASTLFNVLPPIRLKNSMLRQVRRCMQAAIIDVALRLDSASTHGQ